MALVGYIVMLLVYDWRLALLSLLFTPVSLRLRRWDEKAGAARRGGLQKAAGALCAPPRWIVPGTPRPTATTAVRTARRGTVRGCAENYERTAVRSNVWQSGAAAALLGCVRGGRAVYLVVRREERPGSGWCAWNIAAFTTFCPASRNWSSSHRKLQSSSNSVQKPKFPGGASSRWMKLPEQLAPLEVPAPRRRDAGKTSPSPTPTSRFCRGLPLTAHPGDIIGITGPRCSGKSTLGRVFLCEAPYGGSAKFGDKEFSNLTPRQISATVGYLGHDPELSADTVKK